VKLEVRQSRIVLAAGGTGGHLFPAQALAEALSMRGHDIHLVTDERVRAYGKTFPASQTHIVPSASLSLSKPMKVPLNMFRLLAGVLKARRLFQQIRPAAVVGFGGYPSLPPLWASTMMGIPSIVHEQNAVLGRANALLAPRVMAIATSFERVFNLNAEGMAKSVMTGNPVRQMALNFAAAPYPSVDERGTLNVVIFGGSQGARFFSDIMPEAVKLLPDNLRARLSLVQQCREEDLQRVQQAYGAMRVPARLSAFFGNMPEEIARSHLVICRSGASSIAELGVIGRPAILVPLPHAIDNDQQKNAESFAAVGAGTIQPQNQLTAEVLANHLQQLLSQPQALKEAAAAAARHGKPDAAQKLADLVERHISRHVTATTGEMTT
jgi:UDP-N-acetylglucosamine--N-acetylmuramyl-(pentapeptide) pyrophosphoryl-undecaprenol N-acetylglucosamine transferase